MIVERKKNVQKSVQLNYKHASKLLIIVASLKFNEITKRENTWCININKNSHILHNFYKNPIQQKYKSIRYSSMNLSHTSYRNNKIE